MKNGKNTRRKANADRKKRFCVLLALLTVFATALPLLPASASVVEQDAAAQSRLAEVKEVLGASGYGEYIRAHTDLYVEEHGRMPMGSGEIVIRPGDYDPEQSTAAGVRTEEAMGRNALYLPDEGTVSFKFSVANEGLYNLSFDYLQVVGRTSAIERMVRINGKVPFKEARYITLTKTYVDDYDIDPETNLPVFRRDIKDNEIRPTKSESPGWRNFLAEDSTGFVAEPLMFYLAAGENTLTLEAVRESVFISEMKFLVAEAPPSYEEYRNTIHAGKPNGSADIELIQAQTPAATSEIVIYALNDRTSAITQPQDASRIRLNSIGGGRWQDYGQWIRYEFEIPAGGAGMYYIVPRFKQSIYSGVYSSRRIRLNGEVPFAEANNLRFNFSDNWQTLPLNDGTPVEGSRRRNDFNSFEFYLGEGKHEIEFEVVLGDMAEVLGRVERSVMNLNETYRKIRMITGATPDANRDYGFIRTIPTTIEGMWEEALNLRAISAELEEIIGSKGEHTTMLDRMALQLDRMANNNDRIAPGLDHFKANIGGLATWLLERRNQPLEIDYIKIHRIDEKLPRAEANFFQAVGFEFMSFVMSFFADYNSQGAMTEIDDRSKVVEVWMGSSAPVMGGLALAGRDQAQVVRQLVVDFTQQTDIQVNLKLVAGGSLLPSVLAGVGPDIAVANGGGDAVNFAIRSAVLPLNYALDKETRERTPVDYSKGDPSRGIKSFDEVITYFTPSAMIPLTLQDSAVEDNSLLQVFGLPETQTFPMLFYRKDIFMELELEVPRTWEELNEIVPALQTKNLEVGILPGMLPLMTFMFQNNVPLYRGDGIEINLTDNFALDSMKRMTNLYTEYKFPIEFNFMNRFRSGEMPISVQHYDAYNQLMVFAPEIRGLWEFVPMPGTIRERTPEDAGMEFAELENGLIIDNSSPAGVVCTLMMRSTLAKENMENSWAFMQWWVSAGTQGRFGSELVALMGAAAKYPTANLEALANMPWPTADYRNLEEQFKTLKAVPEVPGGYIVGRYVDFVWKSVYNDGESAVELTQDHSLEINKELTRKRNEFKMPVVPRDRFGRRIEDENSLSVE
ncbi:MAG: extracellular solute-binding protein [Oscillospiraceae bacterium]|nr:extracellular solute-binding protein [Oscillospiraceae bacterium]